MFYSFKDNIANNMVIQLDSYRLVQAPDHTIMLIIDKFSVGPASMQIGQPIGTPKKFMQTIEGAGPPNVAFGGSHDVGTRERYLLDGLPTKSMNTITVGENCKVVGKVFNKSTILSQTSEKGSYTYFFFELEDSSGVLKISAYDKFAYEFFDKIMVN